MGEVPMKNMPLRERPVAIVFLVLAIAFLAASYAWSLQYGKITFQMVCDRFPVADQSYPIHTDRFEVRAVGKGEKLFFIGFLDRAGRLRSTVPYETISYDQKDKTCEWEIKKVKMGTYTLRMVAYSNDGLTLGDTIRRIYVTRNEGAGVKVEIPPLGYTGQLPDVKKKILCDLIFRHNAAFSPDHKTILRWKDDKIAIYTGGSPWVKEGVIAWQKVLDDKATFQFTASPPEKGIIFTEGGAVDEAGRPGCGNAEGYEDFNRVVIHLSPIGFMMCPPRKQIVMHELGHALGFFGHTEGRGSIMEDSDAAWRKMEAIDEETGALLRNVYSHPAGSTMETIGCDVD